jgi:hypothetical protein
VEIALQNVAVQPGNWLKYKKYPAKELQNNYDWVKQLQMHLAHSLALLENAIPNTVEQALPKTISQLKVSHLLGCVGRFNPKNVGTCAKQ